MGAESQKKIDRAIRNLSTLLRERAGWTSFEDAPLTGFAGDLSRDVWVELSGAATDVVGEKTGLSRLGIGEVRERWSWLIKEALRLRRAHLTRYERPEDVKWGALQLRSARGALRQADKAVVELVRFFLSSCCLPLPARFSFFSHFIPRASVLAPNRP